jgi:RNA polymerase sigma factor (sigma-70 family)
MDENEFLAERFEEHRGQLRAVAYRMLGSVHEADDAVQEAWLRLDRSGAEGVDNLGGWLTTVVARICLDSLRSRRSRREDPLDQVEQWRGPGPAAADPGRADPEQQALLADSVGLALLVVLDTLAPAERLAFVLHDLFAVPFDEIAPIVERSPAAARQLASRARRRVQGADPEQAETDPGRQRAVVEAWLAATRGGDFAALLALLDPDAVLRLEGGGASAGRTQQLRGAHTVAGQALSGGRLAALARPALVDGRAGIVVEQSGRVQVVLSFTIRYGLIAEIHIRAGAARVAGIDVAELD